MKKEAQFQNLKQQIEDAGKQFIELQKRLTEYVESAETFEPKKSSCSKDIIAPEYPCFTESFKFTGAMKQIFEEQKRLEGLFKNKKLDNNAHYTMNVLNICMKNVVKDYAAYLNSKTYEKRN